MYASIGVPVYTKFGLASEGLLMCCLFCSKEHKKQQDKQAHLRI